jgi:hypothetical protein
VDQVSIAFPKGSVVCATGDYLICHHSGEGWKVYRVEDLLLVKRLLPLLNDPSALLVEEHTLDSIAPAYFNEVHLLLTAFDSNFADEAEALQAIQLQTPKERAKRLLRAAREFTEADCRVAHA